MTSAEEQRRQLEADAARARVRFSVVVPAHDAEATIRATLDSLLAQTHEGWEAIVVDDGSTDATGDVAGEYAARDARVGVIRQAQAGEGGARNTAIAAASNEWLSFVDADDWIARETFERFAAAIVASPELGGLHCGWILVDEDGRPFGEFRCDLSGDLFDALAVAAQFPVHACVVRRALVEQAGGFDTELRSCADWDLWQRVARTGARFGAVPDALAFYRMRPGNTWTAGKQFLGDGLRVVARGHDRDPRVRDPLAAHAAGRSRDDLAAARLRFVCSPAAMEIARGGDARDFLDALPDEPAPDLSSALVAHTIFYSAPRSLCRPLESWAQLWPEADARLAAFLAGLEQRAQASGLARSSARALESLVLAHAVRERPRTIGATHAVRVEITAPIPAVETAATIERLECALTLEGEPFGVLTLPVCDGVVPSSVLADAIAAEHGWRILGRFFERTIYRDLEMRVEGGRVAITRAGVVVASDVTPPVRPQPPATTASGTSTSSTPAPVVPPVAQWAHAGAGWTVFLQELCGHPDWPRERFFAKEISGEPAPRIQASDALVCELGVPIPDVSAAGEVLDVIVTVGGAALGVVQVPTQAGRLGADRLRAAVISAGGMELCRVAVREVVLGRPLTEEPVRLRARLAVLAADRGIENAGPPLAREALSAWRASLSARVLYGWPNAMVAALPPARPDVVVARRHAPMADVAACRRATLPAAAASAVQDCAAAAGELVLHRRVGAEVKHLAYVPDVAWRAPAPRLRALAAASRMLGATSARQARVQGVAAASRAARTATPRAPGSTGAGRAFETTSAARAFESTSTARAFGVARAAAPAVQRTDRIPILMYHRIAAEGAASTARYRLAPAAFEQQLAVLRDAGYRSLALSEWRDAVWSRAPLEGRPVILTFDDGHYDFATEAWPRLERYGFTAVVFVVAARIGAAATWEAMRGEQPALLGWDEIERLSAAGVVFGSHSATHERLTGLSPADMVQEMACSRAILVRGLGANVDAIAYPHGAHDAVVRHLAGACGYSFGFSCEPGFATFDDPLLALPRVEVRGDWTLTDFRTALGIEGSERVEGGA